MLLQLRLKKRARSCPSSLTLRKKRGRRCLHRRVPRVGKTPSSTSIWWMTWAIRCSTSAAVWTWSTSITKVEMIDPSTIPLRSPSSRTVIGLVELPSTRKSSCLVPHWAQIATVSSVETRARWSSSFPQIKCHTRIIRLIRSHLLEKKRRILCQFVWLTKRTCNHRFSPWRRTRMRRTRSNRQITKWWWSLLKRRKYFRQSWTTKKIRPRVSLDLTRKNYKAMYSVLARCKAS